LIKNYLFLINKEARHTMKIFAFAGSNSSTSINKQLVKFVLKSFEQQHDIDLIDLNDYDMPIFSVDRKKKVIPTQLTVF